LQLNSAVGPQFCAASLDTQFQHLPSEYLQ